MVLGRLGEDTTAEITTAVSTIVNQAQNTIEQSGVLQNPYFKTAVMAGLTVWSVSRLLEKHSLLTLAGVVAYFLLVKPNASQSVSNL